MKHLLHEEVAALVEREVPSDTILSKNQEALKKGHRFKIEVPDDGFDWKVTLDPGSDGEHASDPAVEFRKGPVFAGSGRLGFKKKGSWYQPYMRWDKNPLSVPSDVADHAIRRFQKMGILIGKGTLAKHPREKRIKALRKHHARKRRR